MPAPPTAVAHALVSRPKSSFRPGQPRGSRKTASNPSAKNPELKAEPRSPTPRSAILPATRSATVAPAKSLKPSRDSILSPLLASYRRIRHAFPAFYVSIPPTAPALFEFLRQPAASSPRSLPAADGLRLCSASAEVPLDRLSSPSSNPHKRSPSVRRKT